MAAVTLTDVQVEEIRREARAITPGRTALAIVGWVFYTAGFLAAKLMSGVVWGTIRFIAASVKVGWKTANGPSKRDIITQQAALIADMKMRLSRFDG